MKTLFAVLLLVIVRGVLRAADKALTITLSMKGDQFQGAQNRVIDLVGGGTG